MMETLLPAKNLVDEKLAEEGCEGDYGAQDQSSKSGDGEIADKNTNVEEDSISEFSYRKGKKFNFFRRWFKCCYSDKISVEDETESSSNGESIDYYTLLSEMYTTIKLLDSSQMYQEILDMLQTNRRFLSNMERVLGGSNSKMLMVLYALGSIGSNDKSRDQFALAILLKRDFPYWISSIEAYDPVISDTDAKVMELFGCNVLSFDEACSRRIEKPTLFYMPYALTQHIGNLLAGNWSPSCLNQMILLSCGFEDIVKFWRDLDIRYSPKIIFWKSRLYSEPRDYFDWYDDEDDYENYKRGREYVNYIEAIQKQHTLEFALESDYNYSFGFSFIFFHLDPETDMASLFTANREKRFNETKQAQY